MFIVRILILGLLNDQKSRNGYEIQQELKSWNSQPWANISYGSIDFALKKMADEALLKIIEIKSVYSKPEKNFYEITSLGTEQFLMLLREQWLKTKPLIDPFQVALTFMKDLPKCEIIAALEFRIKSLKLHIKSMQRSVSFTVQAIKPMALDIAQLELSIAHSKVELDWVKETIQKVQNKKLL